MTDLDLMKTLTQKADTKIILLVMDGLGGLPREVGGPRNWKPLIRRISTVLLEKACWD